MSFYNRYSIALFNLYRWFMEDSFNSNISHHIIVVYCFDFIDQYNVNVVGEHKWIVAIFLTRSSENKYAAFRTIADG